MNLGCKANVLFFDKKLPSEMVWTKKHWIYDLRTKQHFMLKTSPPKREDLDDFVKCFTLANGHGRNAISSEKEPDGRWRSCDHGELIARDKATLDIFRLKDESLEASGNLPDPDLTAQEILDDLKSAPEQVRVTAHDLGKVDARS